jgi:hypothetical protein
MTATLTAIIRGAHHDLSDRLVAATAAFERHDGRRDIMATMDSFLAPASQHVSAVGEMIVPLARHRLVDGRQRADTYLDKVRQLEHTMTTAKRHLYGEARSQSRSWSTIWDRLKRDFAEAIDTEQALLHDLLEHLTATERLHLGERLRNLEAHSPTRPHPHAPHSGKVAHTLRRVYARADRVWDALEGRVTALR